MANFNCDSCVLVSENIKPYTIIEKHGIKIGLLGIIDFDLKNKVPYSKIIGLHTIGIKESVDKWVPIVNSLSDITIILTSTGVPYDREEVYNNFIADLKSNNHSKNKYETSILNAN